MFSKIRPFIFKLDPELAHDLAIKALKTNLIVKDYKKNELILKTKLFGKIALLFRWSGQRGI